VRGALGALYLRRNQYDAALRQYSAILAIDPGQAEPYAQIAQVHLRTGKILEAVQASQKALELDPKNQSARYTLGNALIRLGRNEEGQKELQRFQEMQAVAQAQEHHTRELMALNQEALADIQQQEYDRAIALFQRAVEFEPESGLSHLKLALALVKAGKHEDAAQNLQKALELNFDFPDVHRYLAEEYKLLGKLEDSEKQRAIYAHMKAQKSNAQEGKQ
jgi:predicted Zn-dependent protease